MHPIPPCRRPEAGRIWRQVRPTNAEWIERIKTLVLDEDKIDKSRQLFKLKFFYNCVLVRRDLADAISKQGFTSGIEVDGVQQVQMILEDSGLPISYEAAFFMQAMEDPSLPLEDMGELSLTIGQKLRSLAIIALVSKADRTLFGQNLVRSGRVRVAYLRRLQREGVANDHHSASGRIDGLMDALAASDLELGREIVGASRAS